MTKCSIAAVAWFFCFDPGCATLQADDARSIFADRILPIVKSENSSSCTECHFGGVELRNFVGSDQTETFAAVRQQGLINVEHPDDSKILEFIARHGTDTRPELEATRQAEYEAFREWIRLAVRGPELLAASTDVVVGNELDPEVLRR